MTEPGKIPKLDYAPPPDQRRDRLFKLLVVAGIALGSLVIFSILIHWLRKAT